MSFRALLRLRSSAALQPDAGRALKPLKPTAAHATVPSTAAAAPHKLLLPRISYSSAYTSPLPAAALNFLGAGHGSSSTAAMEPAKKGEDDDIVIVAGGGIRGRRCPPGTRCVAQCSKACRIYGEIYACIYVLSWTIGRIIVLGARDGREWLRRYVREKFSRKR